MKQAQAEVRNSPADFSQVLREGDQPSAISPTFLEIAVPLAKRCIPVIPVEPCEKRCLLPDWQRRATTDLEQIARWNAENPNYNVGCVAKPDGIVVLDCDVKGLMRRIEDETGQKFPDTLVVRSAGKGCAHVYFLQTELSRKLGNRKAAGLFDLQSVDKYVVGPRSRLDKGRTYEVFKDAPIAPFPDWLYNWVLAHADQPKSRTDCKAAGSVGEDFDFADFCDWYDISGDWDGEWFITDVCPVAGYKHEQSTRTGFYFDGGSLGFHCFASGCAGSGMTVGQVIKFLNQTHEPYRGVIWEEEPIGELLEEFGVEDVDAVQPSGDAGESASTQAERAATISSEEAPLAVAASVVASPLVPATAAARDALAFPEQFIYGEAGVLAKQMRMPLGLAYMALIGEHSARCSTDVMCGTRINTYTVLIAAVGGGKNQAMDRAQQTLGLARGAEYVKGAPAGTRALMTLLGDKPKRGSAERVPGPKKLLLISHEMGDVLKAVGIENSTLASRLCDFWDDNEHVYPTKEGVITVDCRLSWIGGVPASADNPTRFTELFDGETSHGLYDRLLIGYSEQKFNYKPWRPQAKSGEVLDFSDYTAGVERVPFVESVSEGAQRLFDSWEPVGGGSRVKQNCMKVALITTMMNREHTVTEECMRCAIGIMEWQIELRRVFTPGEAVNDEAKCRVAILTAMEAAGAKDKHVNMKRMAHDRKWGGRFGDRIVKTVIANLEEMGEIVPKLVETEGEKPRKSKSEFKLRNWG